MRNSMYPSKIVDGFARLNKKNLYELTRDSSSLTKRQRLRYELLVVYQLKWDELRTKEIGNLNSLKSMTNYYRCYLLYFLCTLKPYSIQSIAFDRIWLKSTKDFTIYEQNLKHALNPLPPELFEQFITLVSEYISETFKLKNHITHAWQILVEFIKFQNKNFILAEYHYPIPAQPQQSKPNLLSIDESWVMNGKVVQKIIKAVINYWSKQKQFELDESIGWLLFSGIIYGGINDKNLLTSWVRELLNRQIQLFINYRVLLSVRYAHKRHGNERNEDEGSLFNTQQLIVDLVSQCWLMKILILIEEPTQWTMLQTPENIEKLLKDTLQPILQPLDINTPSLAWLLRNASYHWEMLEGTSIDQASVVILQGRQRNTGLVKPDFESYLNNTYKVKPADYDLIEVLNLKVESSSKQGRYQPSDRYHTPQIRNSDLIVKIRRAFDWHDKYKKLRKPKNSKGYRQVLPYIADPIDLKVLQSLKWKEHITLLKSIRRLSAHFNDLSEQILIAWVIGLLTQPKPPSHKTILKYLSAIGYEWLYFTIGQPINIWTEEDFEELYEEVLDYKALERGNEDIGYPAKLYKRLHSFAIKEFDIAPATIEQANAQRKVRAELVSPQAYNTILAQLRVSIDPLEADMFILLFILVYRTGMRKKEVLGLRYTDIEALTTDEPSIIIRPNAHRSTKTQGSIRRIAVFALLKPAELKLFINYIQSNIGNNPNRYIFTLSSSNQPIPDYVPLQLLRKVLQDISIGQRGANSTFHAFRHTAVSNLALVLNAPTELVLALTDYDVEDILRIKKGLLGLHIDAQDHWYALSGLMGHLSPQRSFEYYNHVATLMATYQLSCAKIVLPFEAFYNITDISKKRLKENGTSLVDESVEVSQIRKLLLRKVFNNRYKKPPPLAIEQAFEIESTVYETVRGADLITRYGINRVVDLLRALKQNLSIEGAANQQCIAIKDAVIFYERAQTIAKIKTTRGQPRLIRPSEEKGLVLTTSEIQHQSDRRLLAILLRNVVQLRRDDFEAWQWFIAIASRKLSNSTPSVSFTQKDLAGFKRFTQIAIKLLPAKFWLVKANNELLERCREDGLIEGIRVKQVEDFATVHIGSASKDPRNSNYQWQYSPLLRFFVYMMMICDERLDLDRLN